MSNIIESQVFAGELWIKTDDHHRAVGEIEAEWQRRCEIIQQEVSYWRKRHDAVMDSVMKTSFFHAHPPVTLMAEPQSFEAGRVMERAAMMQLFIDPENQPTQHGTVTVEYMQREIAAEREACARVCEELELKSTDGEFGAYVAGWSDGTDDCAAAIRARSQS